MALFLVPIGISLIIGIGITSIVYVTAPILGDLISSYWKWDFYPLISLLLSLHYQLFV